MGRPPKPPNELMKPRTIRLPPELWVKIDQHGLDWLRTVIKQAKPPKD